MWCPAKEGEGASGRAIGRTPARRSFSEGGAFLVPFWGRAKKGRPRGERPQREFKEKAPASLRRLSSKINLYFVLQVQGMLPQPGQAAHAALLHGHSFLDVLWKTANEATAERIASEPSGAPNIQPVAVMCVRQTPMNAAMVRARSKREATARTALQAPHSQQEEPHIGLKGDK